MKEDMVFIFQLAVVTLSLQGSVDADFNKTFFLAGSTSFNDFELTLIRFNHHFVDKTMFIAELIERQRRCDLISRPSRWGKSFNMEMTASFFDLPHFDNGSADFYKRDMIMSLFVGGSRIVLPKDPIGEQTEEPTVIQTTPLKISKVERAMREMGRHPTILVSFMDFGDTFDEFIENFAGKISELIFTKNYTLFLPKHCKATGMAKTCHELLYSTKEQLAGNLDLLKHSIEVLIGLLASHFNSNTVVLIDEYDYPLNRMICNDADFNQTAKFLRSLFTRTFKGDTKGSIYLGVVTGVLQFSRAGISTGLNVCAFSSILEDRYWAHFGFTEKEVETLCEKNPAFPHNMTVLKTWYDGYTFGEYRMYNPVSIRGYFESNQTADYWMKCVPFGSNPRYENNPLHRPFMTDKHQSSIQRLFVESAVQARLKSEIDHTNATTDTASFLSVLTALGYTTCKKITETKYNVSIPNKEVRGAFKEIIRKWTETHLRRDYDAMKNLLDEMLEGLKQKNVVSIEDSLTQLLSGIKETANATIYRCDLVFGLLVTFSDDWDVTRSFEKVITISQKLEFQCNIIVTLKPDPNDDSSDSVMAVNFMVNGDPRFEVSSKYDTRSTTLIDGRTYIQWTYGDDLDRPPRIPTTIPTRAPKTPSATILTSKGGHVRNVVKRGIKTMVKNKLNKFQSNLGEFFDENIDKIIQASKLKVEAFVNNTKSSLEKKKKFKFLWHTCVIIGQVVLGIFPH